MATRLQRTAPLTVPAAYARLLTGAAAVATMAAVAWLIVQYFATFWWPPDEGAYAYVAQRILRGDVLNRDIQDIHAGYVNFANAAALWLFGEDLLSLRYPLAVMAWVQAALAFLLFGRSGPLIASVAAVALTALSTVQFLNPTAHWYALFLAVGTIFVLSEMPRAARGRIELVGFLLVATFLFRQLSGVFLAMGAVTCLLAELPRASPPRPWAARAVLAVMLAGLVGYLTLTLQPTNFILFGAAPILLLVALYPLVGADTRSVVRLTGRLALGGAIAALPLALYHLLNGSVSGWYNDIVVAAFSQTDLEFIRRPLHLAMLSYAVAGIASAQTIGAVVNGLFWLALLLLPAVNGVLLLRAVRAEAGAIHPLPVVAVFFALVSVHNQIPIYMWFSSGLSLLAFLWLTQSWLPPGRALAVGAAAAIAGVALYWHAAQPVERGLMGTLQGERFEGGLVDGPPRATLQVTQAEAGQYADLVDLIRGEVPESDTILAIPNNPELYFLGNRPAATGFWNSAFGLRSDADVEAVLRTLAARPPRLVFHLPEDKYNTARSDRIMAAVRERYDLIARKHDFDIYRLRLTRP